ncbi:sensor histidine kinase [Novosphingobium gossypii]|uniref:sensor histidine kinase n=1 Tax=Novosphingobium gossypii TaxID=1604774 RepID=UPI003D1C86E1
MLATLSIAVIAVVRALFITSLLPWLLFIPVILIVALVFGQRVGVYASFLSAFAAAITIGSTAQPLFLSQAQWTGSVLFLVVTAMLARLVGELRLVFQKARSLNTELEERQGFLAGVLASSTDCIKVLDLDGRMIFMSEGGMKVMDVSDFNQVKDCPWLDFWESEGHLEAEAAIARAQAGRSSHFIGKAETFAGTSKWWDVSVSPILKADGKPDRILSVSRDMTPLMEAREQQQLLIGELGHRLKNVLALVQSIASQTFRQSENIKAADAAFFARLSALGQATDVLTSTAWQAATLHEVVKAGMSSVGDAKGRVELDGPDIRLDAQVALALTLALHELTTNACKYGALSNEEGTISLRWAKERAPNSPEPRFILQWQEKGGPAVTPPARKGFGSKMIERSLGAYFRGETSLDFDPAGVIFRIDAPLPKASASER